MTIYLAAPLFTQAERIWNKSLAAQLSALVPGAEVILPQVRGSHYVKEGITDFQGLVRELIGAIEHATMVIAVLDGSDADSGTCWECGYAYARGKKIIAIRTDLRSGGDDGLNAMLRRTCAKVIYHAAIHEDIGALAELIAAELLKSD